MHGGGASGEIGEVLEASRPRLGQVRVLMYSHDTFGLGHLRRCRTIAHALVDAFKGVHVLIISGSQIAGAFDFKARVDFVKVPSVIKLYNGEYTSISRHINIQETLAWRRAIILSTAASFDPDLMIVDKEPLGLRGELVPTLELLKGRDCRLVVGLRDVMDDPQALEAEWRPRNVLAEMTRYYDDVWIYGPEGFWNPLSGLTLPPGLSDRFLYTGFLERHVPAGGFDPIGDLPEDYILVTAGGGGDGAPLMSAVLAAHRFDHAGQRPLVMVLGPFINAEDRARILAQAADVTTVKVIDFHNRPELLLRGAAGVVSMAGYNTFCEILSFDRPALLVPRVAPRAEQLIRARQAHALGLVDMLLPEQAADPALLAARLRALPNRPRPMSAGAAAMLDGIDHICHAVRAFFETRLPRDVFLPPAAE